MSFGFGSREFLAFERSARQAGPVIVCSRKPHNR
jgi:hypothetical protein